VLLEAQLGVSVDAAGEVEEVVGARVDGAVELGCEVGR
jgi:hypothetical protein